MGNPYTEGLIKKKKVCILRKMRTKRKSDKCGKKGEKSISSAVLIEIRNILGSWVSMCIDIEINMNANVCVCVCVYFLLVH